MRTALLQLACALTAFGCLNAHGQDSSSGNTPDASLQERLRSAQVTEKRLGDETVFTEVKFAGGLQPNYVVGCIPIAEVLNTFNPPTLVYAAKKCIQQGQYQQAWALFSTANAFAYYDLRRLADKSTRGALSVLVMNAFADLPPPQAAQAQRVSEEMRADPERVKEYCAQLTRIGAPGYEPNWAILAGIGAYEEPRNGPYLTNVVPATIWEEIRSARCKPQPSR